jgi:hypothetical protein
MRSSIFLLCVALGYSLSTSASPDTDDADVFFPQQMRAKDLMTTCASSSLTATGRTRRRYCDGFVSGVEEGMRLFLLRHSINSVPAVCVPAGTTSRALTNAFVNYASAKGVNLEQPAAAVVIEALEKAFSCA